MSENTNTQAVQGPEPVPSTERADATFGQLRQRFVDGRLTLAEFEEQVERAYSTYIPPVAHAPMPQHRTPSLPDASRTRHIQLRTRGAGGELVAYVLVMAMLLGIWALTGMGYFWPIWPMLGWGTGVAGKVLGIHRGGSSRQLSPGQHADGLHGSRGR